MTFHIADFKILKPLGSSTKRKFNDVFLTEHKESGMKAVLKHITKNSANQDHQLKLKFEASLEFLHPNLPKTLLVHETEHELFVIKSYAEGVPLDQYWKSISKKTRHEFLKRFIQAILTLFDELNERKLIHSDIKLSNIIIHGKELDFEVYLIDFGLAFFPASVERKIVFSLAYSAPELILNYLHLARHCTDLFSLGICLWQLMEGKLPLVHPNPAIMTNLQLTHPLPKGVKIDANWNKILSKMCAKASFHKPPNLLERAETEKLIIEGMNKRYQHLSEVCADIENMQESTPFFKRLIKIFSNS